MAAVRASQILQDVHQGVQVIQRGDGQGDGLCHLQGMGAEVLVLWEFRERDILEALEHLLGCWCNSEDAANAIK